LFPANCKGVVAVGASTRQGTLVDYSNHGATILAPGGDAAAPIDIITMKKGGLVPDYGMGTSFAAPHAARVAALGLRLGCNTS
jgi:serine protease